MDITIYQDYSKKIIENCSQIIVGKEEVIRQILVCFFSGGHVLLEDLPGTGKTMLVRAFSKSIGADFNRIQFTPDLLPSDLTGINFYNQKENIFEFRKGPLFSNFILADEINRATPRTQSALLEAMEEKQITIDGVTYQMDCPFMVMATQNPIESYGTFPLPDAQMDRFFMRLSMGYMERQQEMEVISRPSTLKLLEELKCVLSPDEIAPLFSEYTKVLVSEDVKSYIMDIIEATRDNNSLQTGVSTRGAIALYKASQITAAMNGRDYVIPEDVKQEAVPVLAHRIASGLAGSSDSVQFIEKILAKIQVPLEKI